MFVLAPSATVVARRYFVHSALSELEKLPRFLSALLRIQVCIWSIHQRIFQQILSLAFLFYSTAVLHLMSSLFSPHVSDPTPSSLLKHSLLSPFPYFSSFFSYFSSSFSVNFVLKFFFLQFLPFSLFESGLPCQQLSLGLFYASIRTETEDPGKVSCLEYVLEIVFLFCRFIMFFCGFCSQSM